MTPSTFPVGKVNHMASSTMEGMAATKKRPAEKDTAYYAESIRRIGTDARLQIMRLLLAAHPEGMVVGDILNSLQTTPSTLSHHLDKLKSEGLVKVRRETRYLWYSANTDALEELLTFLYSECCSRSKAIKPDVLRLCK